MAGALGLSPERAEEVRLAGLLHDVGKVGISQEIVTATAPLSAAQSEELRRHPEIGRRMLSGSRLALIRPWVLHHHERVDGGGYPAGLSGDEIPLEARIIAAADAFDALVCGRPGQDPAPVEDALRALERVAGAQLDPEVVDALRELVTSGAPGAVPER